MHVLKQVSVIALLRVLTLGKDTKWGNTNFTVAFFSDSDSTSCDSADTSKAVVLTTDSIPLSQTCFNVSDIFSGRNTAGSTNDSLGLFHNGVEVVNRVNWSVSNLNNYNSNANYSRVWYESNSYLGEIEEGVPAPRVLVVYAFEDCIQTGGRDFPYDEWPFFRTSCQTKEGGQCRTVPNTIKSFSLNTAGDIEARKNYGCQTWAFLGAATRINIWSMSMGSLVVGTTVISSL